MKIIVAGKDRTADLGADIQRAAHTRLRGRTPNYIAPAIAARALLKCKSNQEYYKELLRLLRYRDAFDTFDFDISRKPGMIGKLSARLKAMLWKLLRYQFDRIAFRQNLINGMFTAGLEFQDQLRQQEIENLHKRIAALEKLVAAQAEHAKYQK